MDPGSGREGVRGGSRSGSEPRGPPREPLDGHKWTAMGPKMSEDGAQDKKGQRLAKTAPKMAKNGWGQTRINLVEDPQENVVLQMHPFEEKQADELLGFEPPECVSNASVDKDCVQRWFERVRKRSEEKIEHLHHHGCSHE